MLYGYCICVWDASGQSNITTFSPVPLCILSFASGVSTAGAGVSSFVSSFVVSGGGDGAKKNENYILKYLL